MPTPDSHVPVLLPEVLLNLRLQPNDHAIDATLGGGGHARAILDAIAPDGRLLGIEADDRTLKQTTIKLQSYGRRFMPVHGSFRHLHAYAEDRGLPPVAGILFDLGISSLTIDGPDRGFSIRHDGPLDMRYDRTAELTAAQIVNEWSAGELSRIFREYADEPLAERIAERLVQSRSQEPFSRTAQLAAAVESVKRRRGKIHPATQVFQALRIAVNDEFGAVREALPQALAALRPGGRLAIITFHSLEDTIVKHWSKNEAKKTTIRLINKHVITPGRAERLSNPRSRSAKLRVIEKI